jgi:predicted aspartyl protease
MVGVDCEGAGVEERKMRPFWAALSLLCVMSAAAEPQSGSTGSRVDPAPPYTPPADDLLFASPTRLDHIGRIIAPVMINGKGPFRFIIDTGANHSTISPQLARTLGLDAAAERPQQVHGITGTAEVPSVQIQKLQAGELLIENTRFPVVWAPLMAGADGILGVAGLRGDCITVDFQHNSVTIRRAGVAGTPLGYDRIPVRRLDDGLIVVAARVGGVRVDAVIDTGSQHTIGNNALRDALAWQRRRGEAANMTDVYGATTDVASGRLEVVPTIDFGRVKVAKVTVVYGDFHIFEVWGMQTHPTIIIGMDVLGTVNALSIDFQHSELYVDSAYHLSEQARAD